MPARTVQTQPNLTPRQLQLLKAITVSQRSRCCSPTIAELAEKLNLSRSTVFEHIGVLRKKGLLSASAGKARSLQPTAEAHGLLEGLADSDEPEEVPGGIPLLGVVAAGTPIEAVENAEQLSLTSYFGLGDDMFALEVRGDSMIDDDIRQGDYIICRRRSTAQDGQLVVAIVDEDTATLKRFYSSADAVRLQPANDDYDPIYTRNCRIEAVVVGLVRKL